MIYDVLSFSMDAQVAIQNGRSTITNADIIATNGVLDLINHVLDIHLKPGERSTNICIHDHI